ncbi:hypothetical protein CU048_08800 [Beijerinckiaceae bacterium]|nr:hypothetical protein CU048_08800 [Beijerinckiaceae bacterium]
MTSNQLTVGFRLSQQQERLWRLRDQIGRDLPPLLGRLRLDGPLDAERLQDSLRRVVWRHEALRTRIELLSGTTQPIQVIGEATPFVNFRDLSQFAPESRIPALSDIESETQCQDLRGDALHAELVHFSPNLHYLIIAVSPLCCDFVSLQNLVRELAAGYDEGMAEAALATEPLQYADYAAWQEDILASGEGDGVRYWRQREPSDMRTRLALENDAANATSFNPAVVRLQLPQELASLLSAFAEHHHAAPATILLAAWAALLHRHSGLPEIELCFLGEGRSEAIATSIGAFALPLPLRCGFESDESFTALVQRLQAALDEHRDWQDYAPASATRRSDNSVLPLCFGYIAGLPPLRAGSVLMTLQAAPVQVEPLRLHLQCLAGQDGIEIEFHHDQSRFSSVAINCLSEQWWTLLGDALNAPDTPIGRLALLSDAERDRLLLDYRRAESSVTVEAAGLHALLDRQVETGPDMLALRHGELAWTYAELHRRANFLAARLLAQGLQTEDRVGLLLQNPLWMIAGIFAVLRAGGAYVPLDPAYPVDRISFVIRDAAVRFVLTERACLHVADASDSPCIVLDEWFDGEPNAELRGEQIDGLARKTESDQLAYLIYTSGSTGRPKGVAISHGAALHSTLSRHLYYPAPVRGFLLLSSFSFDSSVAGLFWTLGQGGCLCLPTAEELQDPAALTGLVERHALSHLLCLPSLYALMLDQDRARLRSLQAAIVAGESCPSNLPLLHYERLPHASLYNEYGPTEAAVWSTVLEVAPQSAQAPVSIGRPIPGTRLGLFDERGELVPRGVVGEIHIGGAGLARGYFGQPDLTGERFVPDPLGPTGSRLYETGDLARYKSDWNIEYVGRIDHQVKIRGFRIELGEIEAALVRIPEVREAVVTAREDIPGEKRLVAYVVGADGVQLAAAAVRTALQRDLPDYLVPSAFVVLEMLPITANGKVNRNALPPPDLGHQLAQSYVAPRTVTEELLTELWADVLGLERVGIEDNFFELGGHSLLATQVISRIRQTFAIELRLRSLFESPTVAALAPRVETARSGAETFDAPPLVAGTRQDPLPLSFAQQRLWFLDQLEPGNSSYCIPAAVRLVGDLDVAALEVGLRGLVQRHEVLRTSFPTKAGQPRQLIARELDLPFSRVDLCGPSVRSAEAEMRCLLDAEAKRSFDLARGPLLRATLFKLDEQDHVLALMLHHIVSDGWSTDVLIRDFAAMYTALSCGQQPDLPELPVQYADFSCWQRGWLQGEALEKQLSYWLRQLEGAPSVLALPTDRPRPAVQSYRGKTIAFELSPAVAQTLHALGRNSGATLFMVLLAAFKVLLMRYSGQNDLCVGTLIANRTRLEIEGLIGFFANTLVLRTDLSGDPTFLALLELVRETALQAQAHQDLPFEKLVEELQPTRDPSHSPLCQVLFVLQNAPLRALDLPGLHVEPVEVGTQTARFDLTLAMMERGNTLAGEWEYNADLFDAETAARMLRDYVTLLESIAARPQAHLSELCGVQISAAKMIDRVPPPESGQLAKTSFVAPRTPTEEILSDLFAQVLGIEQVSIHADFFQLGGHSMLACILAYRIRETLRCNLPLVAIFQAPSVAQLANFIEQSCSATHDGRASAGLGIVSCRT